MNIQYNTVNIQWHTPPLFVLFMAKNMSQCLANNIMYPISSQHKHKFCRKLLIMFMMMKKNYITTQRTNSSQYKNSLQRKRTKSWYRPAKETCGMAVKELYTGDPCIISWIWSISFCKYEWNKFVNCEEILGNCKLCFLMLNDLKQYNLLKL